MVIAISPTLVTVMVTSLALFVSTILNPSPFMSRFNFVLMMYSMATVAIARISIEEGKERAVLFGMPLAAVTLLAMTTLVQYEDAIGGMKFIYSAIVIAITWWSAHKITWDCTVIEDHDDSSGQGLLQKIGLEDLIAESSSNKPDSESPTQTSLTDESKLTWFERWKENRKKPHTPGVWVIYYSLAALPLFGFGQFLADTATNELCFKYLFLYVASGLGLLLTTSFLGLRRYLRHRDVEMPVEMASMWLSVGALMIAAFMVIALILPRPGNARQLTDVSSWFNQSQDEYETSEYGVGPDGKQEGQDGESTDSPESTGSEGTENSEDSESKSGIDQGNQGDGNEQSEKGNTSSSDSNNGGQSDEGEMEGNVKEDNGDASNHGDSENQDSQNSNQQDGNAGQSQSPQQEGSDDTENNNDSNQSSNENQLDNSVGEQGSPNQSNNPNDSQENQTSDDKQQSEASESSFQMPEIPSLGILGKIFQILFWVVVGLALIYYLIKNHKALLTALKEMITGFLDWLSSVFAGTQAEPLIEEQVPEAVSLPLVAPFRSFHNPFTMNTQMNLNELVQYSFKALESLGYELGISRDEDQTPNEFIQAIANHITPLGQSAQRLGRHYSLAAYAPGMLNQSCLEDLKTFWQQLSIVEISPITPTNEPVSS